jgi:hypothetical protein
LLGTHRTEPPADRAGKLMIGGFQATQLARGGARRRHNPR